MFVRVADAVDVLSVIAIHIVGFALVLWKSGRGASNTNVTLKTYLINQSVI